jgi:hypothetical protein
VAVHGEFQELVVRGIAARGDPLGDRHRLRRCRQFPKPFLRGGRDQRRKVRGRARTSNNCRSVAWDFSKVPRCATM